MSLRIGFFTLAIIVLASGTSADSNSSAFNFTGFPSIPTSNAQVHELASQPTYWYALGGLEQNEGNDLGAIVGVSVAACEAACDNKTGCHSVSYEASDGQCRFKDKVGSSTDPINPNPVYPFTTFYSSDVPNPWHALGGLEQNEGNDLGAIVGVSVAACEAACDKKSGCRSVSFEASDGQCRFKDKQGSPTDPINPNPVYPFTTYYKVPTELCGHHEDTTDKKCTLACAKTKFSMKGIDQTGSCPTKYNVLNSQQNVEQCPDGVTNIKYCPGQVVTVTVKVYGQK